MSLLSLCDALPTSVVSNIVRYVAIIDHEDITIDENVIRLAATCRMMRDVVKSWALHPREFRDVLARKHTGAVRSMLTAEHLNRSALYRTRLQQIPIDLLREEVAWLLTSGDIDDDPSELMIDTICTCGRAEAIRAALELNDTHDDAYFDEKAIWERCIVNCASVADVESLKLLVHRHSDALLPVHATVVAAICRVRDPTDTLQLILDRLGCGIVGAARSALVAVCGMSSPYPPWTQSCCTLLCRYTVSVYSLQAPHSLGRFVTDMASRAARACNVEALHALLECVPVTCYTRILARVADVSAEENCRDSTFLTTTMALLRRHAPTYIIERVIRRIAKRTRFINVTTMEWLTHSIFLDDGATFGVSSEDVRLCLDTCRGDCRFQVNCTERHVASTPMSFTRETSSYIAHFGASCCVRETLLHTLLTTTPGRGFDLPFLRHVLSAHPAISPVYARRLLHAATAVDDAEAVNLIVSIVGRQDAVTWTDQAIVSTLKVAAKNGSLRVIEMLSEFWPDIDVRCAIIEAFASGCDDTTRFILSRPPALECIERARQVWDVDIARKDPDLSLFGDLVRALSGGVKRARDVIKCDDIGIQEWCWRRACELAVHRLDLRTLTHLWTSRDYRDVRESCSTHTKSSVSAILVEYVVDRTFGTSSHCADAFVTLLAPDVTSCTSRSNVLRHAVASSRHDVVRLLIGIWKPTLDEQTLAPAVMCASLTGQATCLHTLISSTHLDMTKIVDFNETLGITPLAAACTSRNMCTVWYLLKAGAPVTTDAIMCAQPYSCAAHRLREHQKRLPS